MLKIRLLNVHRIKYLELFIGIHERFDRSITQLEEFSLQFVDLEKDQVTSSFALETLAKIYTQQKKYNESRTVYDLLKSKYDPIRSNFWDYQISKLIGVITTVEGKQNK